METQVTYAAPDRPAIEIGDGIHGVAFMGMILMNDAEYRDYQAGRALAPFQAGFQEEAANECPYCLDAAVGALPLLPPRCTCTAYCGIEGCPRQEEPGGRAAD